MKNKKFLVAGFVILFIILVSSSFIVLSSTAEENNEVKGVDEGNVQYHLVGEKKTMESFSQNLATVRKAHAPLHEGERFLKSGKFIEAKELYIESLALAKKHALSQWVPRLRLADVYEKLGEKENAIEQFNWLIEHCQNKDTLKQLQLRKQNLLKQ